MGGWNDGHLLDQAVEEVKRRLVNRDRHAETPLARRPLATVHVRCRRRFARESILFVDSEGIFTTLGCVERETNSAAFDIRRCH